MTAAPWIFFNRSCHHQCMKIGSLVGVDASEQVLWTRSSTIVIILLGLLWTMHIAVCVRDISMLRLTWSASCVHHCTVHNCSDRLDIYKLMCCFRTSISQKRSLLSNTSFSAAPTPLTSPRLAQLSYRSSALRFSTPSK